ncbi:MAG: hypothetical protein Q7T93_13345 [Methylobacterium sp.]|uniref:hypothetical protein n=1 Tax=Methylobacterium sp. TaxID=409 RepID=UPI002722C693|nr:hypothetical protein [Methylobacterium sp.]MDO9427802.1 hypothetical protein [Methylobacterium sp.]
MTLTSTIALTKKRYQAEAAVDMAKAAARAVLDLAPGPDTDAVLAARTAATKASRLALLMVEEWLEHERERAEEVLLGEGDAEACQAVLNFEF